MTHDLTTGKPLRDIWQFAVPVLFGLLLQQVYSLVDTAIVGHALGVMALGGVGATGSVNFLVIGFCGGLCTGMAIPLAQAFGAGDYRQLRRYVAGCVWLGIAMSALLLALTLPTTRALLKLMGTPEEQMGYAYDYIFIIFIGIPATILYNMGACVLRSLGDSKSPVWFLAIASVINIVLDLLTVCVLGMGVAGAAIATVVSQLGSGVLCVWYGEGRLAAAEDRSSASAGHGRARRAAVFHHGHRLRHAAERGQLARRGLRVRRGGGFKDLHAALLPVRRAGYGRNQLYRPEPRRGQI